MKFTRVPVFLVLFLALASVVSAQQNFVISVVPEPELKMAPTMSPTAGGLYKVVVSGSNFLGVPTVQVKQGAGPWINQQTLSFTPGTNWVSFYMSKSFYAGLATQVRAVVSNGNITQSYQFTMGTNDPAVYSCNIFGILNPRVYNGIAGLPFVGNETQIGKCAVPQTSIPRNSQIILRGGGFGKDATGGFNFPPVVTATVQTVALQYVAYEENSTSHRWNILLYVPGTVPVGSQQVKLTVNGKTQYFIVTFS